MNSAPDDFVALILTHGRPDNVRTLKALDHHGYTGPWFLVIDDEDDTADDYYRIHGEDRVIQFSKADAADLVDEGDNFPGRRSTIYPRAAMWGIAKQLGYRYFIQLDDDYYVFMHRFDGELRYRPRPIRDLDATWTAMLDFFKACPKAMATICMAQGGDFLGGDQSGLAKAVKTKRKAMNSFVCDAEHPFYLLGRLNEDVNFYTAAQRRGELALTLGQVNLDQESTQAGSGGMTDAYLDAGTYVKSFYSVMHCPSAVRVTELRDRLAGRLHHRVDYNACAPKIVPERFRKLGTQKQATRRV